MKNKFEGIVALACALIVVIVSFWNPGIVVEISVGLFILISLYAFLRKSS